MQKWKFIIVLFAFNLLVINAIGQKRFPKPEFETEYMQPQMHSPLPRANILEYLDILILVGSLSLISWVIVKKRSRKAVFWITVFSVIYFGFYRQGCICSVGSIQNVSFALFNPGSEIPFSALVFFFIPIIYTLLFGRTFCAGICPLGALQELFVFKPINLEAWLEKILGILPFIYLGLAVLYSATGTDFIICRYDPFVGFFRFNASFMMLIVGGIFLLLGVFIARPYCRFLCPYGALLNLFSRFSRKHLTITPNECIQCRLCEDSCPVGSIENPNLLKERENPKKSTKRYISYLIILPVLIIIGGLSISSFHENLAMANAKVRLAKEIMNKTNFGLIDDEALEISGFKTSGQSVSELFEEASNVVNSFYYGSWFLGAYLGLVFGLTLINLNVFRYSPDYTINKATCHSCARCVDYCPIKKSV
ncbi:MAG: 4Fe-4S binding protein [Bacteroidetes bacterium]|jgi:NosR/NirI family transcriptional regulator, nitrous oxide reductase regulator|nr:4Fe-4S binding protein [Bacteroidota bacterium]MBT6685198.1 4Fe-4S binding protein [Bacteroidota bacterium]MBT7143455.1 4Fe-4S binding protein [Bacteroidota bacterium]MBT7492051.1 4Fe-4S binding protein [Bacteroidota bacterium]